MAAAATAGAMVVAAATPADAAVSTGSSVRAGGASASIGVADARLAASAQARRDKRPVQVDALTTADSITVANPNGSFATTTSVLPTRMKSPSGQWKVIDPTLNMGPHGSIGTVATPNALTLSGGGNGPLATVVDTAGRRLSFSLPVSLPAPTLSGAVATYAGVYPGVDLVVTAQPSGGFGEVFVVHDAAAAAMLKSVRFSVGGGLRLTSDKTGRMQAVDPATHAVVATASPAAMWDSATSATGSASAPDGALAAASTASGPGRGAHLAKVNAFADGHSLTLSAAVGALGGGAVRYPVYVDPTWTLPYISDPTQHYTQVQEGCPTFTYYDNVASPGVGYNDYDSCIGKMRAYYQIDTSNVLDPRYVIVSATLKINEVSSSWNSCNQGSQTVSVYSTALQSTSPPVETPITSSTDWNNKPDPGQFISSKLMESVGNSNGTKCPGGVLPGDFDVSAGIAQARANGWASWTFRMNGYEGAGSHSLQLYNNNPSITTVYDIAPDMPSSLGASPTPVTSSGVAQPCAGSGTGWLAISNFGGKHTATLSAKLTSAVASAQMYGIFTLHDDTAGTTLGTYNSSGYVTTGGTVSVQTPTLVDGHQYSWTVQSSDQYYSSAVSSPACVFKADQTAPVTPAVSSTDFPPSGSATGTTKRYGQTGNDSGSVTLTASDPNPSTGSGSGVKGFYYQLDTPIPSSGATLYPASGGSLAVTITPSHWGTSVLYVESVDNAGNVSAQKQYSFFEPWYPGATVTPGDLNGDGIPDLTAATPGGNLVEYRGDSDPASTPLTLSTAQYSPDLQGTSWNRYLVTHRGSFTNQATDDLWAFDTANKHLYLYKNFGANPFENTANVQDVTRAEVDNSDWGGCVPTASTGDCADYNSTDWSTLTQVLAVGDFYAGSPQDVGANDVLTVEGDHLWLYQGQTSPFYLNVAVELGTTGWSNMTLLAPGLVAGKPTLWARNNTTGAVTSYTITFDANGYPVGLGAAGSGGTALSIPGGTALTQAVYPQVVSPGDFHGTGNPDLVVTNGAGTVTDYPGAAPSAGVATFANPVVLGNPNGPAHDWPLSDGSGVTALDTATGSTAPFHGTVAWSTDPTHGTVAGFDGTDTWLTLPQGMISDSTTLTVSVTFQAASGSSGILLSTGHDVPSALNSGAMPVMYIGTDGRLYAQFWTGAVEPIISVDPVNDNAWHIATLTASGNVQTLYLDGHPVRTETGNLGNYDPQVYAGAGVFNTNPWINAPGGNSTMHASYFTGKMSNIVFYNNGPAAPKSGSIVDQETFKSDGTSYSPTSTWYSAKTTMTFAQGLLTLADASTGSVLKTYGISGYPGAVLVLQSDGNLVIYSDSTRSTALWATGTNGNSGDHMVLQSDGNLVIYSSGGSSIWASGTNH